MLPPGATKRTRKAGIQGIGPRTRGKTKLWAQRLTEFADGPPEPPDFKKGALKRAHGWFGGAFPSSPPRRGTKSAPSHRSSKGNRGGGASRPEVPPPHNPFEGIARGTSDEGPLRSAPGETSVREVPFSLGSQLSRWNEASTQVGWSAPSPTPRRILRRGRAATPPYRVVVGNTHRTLYRIGFLRSAKISTNTPAVPPRWPC